MMWFTSNHETAEVRSPEGAGSCIELSSSASLSRLARIIAAGLLPLSLSGRECALDPGRPTFGTLTPTGFDLGKGFPSSIQNKVF